MRLLPRRRIEFADAVESIANDPLVHDLIESSPDALVIVDLDGRIVHVNKQLEELFGYVREELVGEDIEVLVPETQRERHREHRARYVTSPKPRPMVCVRGLRKDGSQVPIDISLNPVRTPKGILIVSTIRDVAERERMDEEVRRNELLFRGLLESAPDAKVIVDGDARIVIVNTQAEKLFGYTREELTGQHVEMLLPERFRDQHRRDRGGFIGAPTTRPMGAGLELFARRKDGSEFPVDISLSPHEGPDGLLILAAIRDVTEKKRAEWEIRRFAAEAEKANAAKSEFLSRMSHELRTPLNSILGFAQVLELDGLSEEQRANVGYIVRAGRHLLSLINEILDMAQIESGRIDLSVEPVAVSSVIAEAIEFVAPLAEERSVEVRAVAPESDGRYAFADQQRLLQVLLNLLGNAVKYSGPNAEVAVSWGAADGDLIRIQVHDTGPGISAEELDNIFAPFERLESAERRIEGTGLGLTLARSLIEAMGGAISVSSAIGEGSTFSVDLPAAPTPEATRREVSPLYPSAKSTRTVLHIEDNLVGQRLVERILTRLPGLEVLGASQGTVGIDFARRYRPDAILLDLHLPDLRGEEVLRRLHEDPDTREIPVVVVSADTSREIADRIVRDGARAFLTKPIDAEVLLAVVDEVTRITP
jgi:PAS domain S-box-containing protein